MPKRVNYFPIGYGLFKSQKKIKKFKISVICVKML